MEALQESYVRAIVASAGAVVAGRPEVDEGVDLEIRHTSTAHLLTDRVARLEIQMKATTLTRTATHITASMSAQRYNYFATSDPTMHKIVVIMAVPTDQAHWTFARDKGLTIHHAAYWVNLAGATPVTRKTIVAAPLTQMFSDQALCDMMERIGRGDPP
jgi:hypothetical protein